MDDALDKKLIEDEIEDGRTLRTVTDTGESRSFNLFGKLSRRDDSLTVFSSMVSLRDPRAGSIRFNW